VLADSSVGGSRFVVGEATSHCWEAGILLRESLPSWVANRVTEEATTTIIFGSFLVHTHRTTVPTIAGSLETKYVSHIAV
jgi:hypothetical protein